MIDYQYPPLWVAFSSLQLLIQVNASRSAPCALTSISDANEINSMRAMNDGAIRGWSGPALCFPNRCSDRTDLHGDRIAIDSGQMRIDATRPQIERKRGSADTALQIRHGFIVPAKIDVRAGHSGAPNAPNPRAAMTRRARYSPFRPTTAQRYWHGCGGKHDAACRSSVHRNPPGRPMHLGKKYLPQVFSGIALHPPDARYGHQKIATAH